MSFFTKEHKPIFDSLIKLYENNSEELDKCATMGGGKVQTILNFELQNHDIKVKELSPDWNMFSMHKREMFSHNWQDGDDKTPHFIKYSWILAFYRFSIEDRTRIMRETWEYSGRKNTMNNIVVFIIAVKKDGQLNQRYEIGIESWRRWCEKNDVHLLLLEEPILPMDEMHIIWQRYFLFDIYDANKIRVKPNIIS